MSTVKQRRPHHALLGLLLTLSLLTGCATQDTLSQHARCELGTVVINSDFPTGRVDDCRQENGEFVVVLRPENTPINNSPWYAFNIQSIAPQSVSVVLEYQHHNHRYAPKISRDGENWTLLDPKRVTVNEDKTRVTLQLDLEPTPLWISGQEIFDNEDYSEWFDTLRADAKRTGLTTRVLGQSTEGRPITLLDIHPDNPKRYIAIVGRQHPPEVTGALALLPFIERLLGDTELARNFRREFGIVMVPNMNPDGVFRGNWRHNVNGLDLNRDWGPFTQKETRLVRDELLQFLSPDTAKLYVFLDFHSTWKDIFYTQLPEMPTEPPHFTDLWLGDFAKNLEADYPDYAFTIKPGHNPDKNTSKAYMHKTFGIPAITFELGDATPRAFIKDYAERAADTLMKRLLLFVQQEQH